jgi:hypothetical protein
MLSRDEIEFLRAAAALVDVQRELTHLFEREFAMTPYDYWIRLKPGRADASSQSPQVGSWQFHFHGLEFEANHEDGRHIRAELGPGGRVDVFTGWSVAIFVFSAKPPWPTYPHVRQLLQCELGHPDFHQTTRIETALLHHGFFEHADPELLALRTRCTRPGPAGQHIIDIPADLYPPVAADVLLCDRLVLSDSGRRSAMEV